MHVVAAVIDQGALTFDFAIPCEVFGLDRRDIVDPWYEFAVVGAGERRVRMQTGFFVDAPHGLEKLEQADTIVVPGWSDRTMNRLLRWKDLSSPRTTVERDSCRLHRRLRPWRPRACSTIAGRRLTGCTRSASTGAIRASVSTLASSMSLTAGS